MELEHIKHIKEAFKACNMDDKEAGLQSRCRRSDDDRCHTIPSWLGCSGGPKLGETLSFPAHPLLVTQKELIGGFKRELQLKECT
jgi:hypothetical protein